ncbi:hypothetical protein Dimus_005372 [Dionaea muscipula]
MIVIHLKKKDIVKSKVRGIEIEFDHEKLATITGVHGANGICEYIKEVWEESKYTKPLEITRRFANDASIMAARRVESGERSRFNDLSILRKINLPRVMIRHMSYVISMKDHELPYGDWLTMVFEAFGVPLVDKKGEEPKRYDFFEDTFLTMCKLTRENGVWWIGSGENRRRDEEVEAREEEAEDVNERNRDDFGGKVVIDEATIEGESGSDDQFYDAQVEVEEPSDETQRAQRVQTTSSTRQKDEGIAESTPRVQLAKKSTLRSFERV